jgi:peptidoglycan hydrolase-like protein with peptidoglycan-binding domain
MSGYNDSGELFDDAVDAVVAEARRQAVPHVIWLTLRDHDVSYQDPQERANADGYQDDNRLLYARADALGGYLQVADWATHAWDHPEWFEYDGVHLTEEGVRGLTTFIAGRVDVVLDGGSLNPDVVPWPALHEGSDGPVVAMVQRALQDPGLTAVGVVDGVYGDQTAAAVQAFQEERGLRITGAVDELTAVALGVLDAADVTASAGDRAPVQPSPRVISRAPAFAPAPAELPREPEAATVAAVVAALVAAAGGAIAVRRRTRPAEVSAQAPPDDEIRVPGPYNYELEESLTG